MAVPPATHLVVAATLAATLTLPWAAEPAFDPRSWLIWGRELAGLELDTSVGPSWKPLPPLLAAPLSLLGDEVAKLAWLLISRAAWLLCAALAGRLAMLLSSDDLAGRVPGGRLTIGALAAAGVVVLGGADTPWLGQGAAGLSEPLAAALALGSFDAWLGRRPRTAALLLAGCALVRPEAGPLLVVLLWRERERIRPLLGALACLLVAALWLVPELLGSGDALAGAGRARVGTGSGAVSALTVLWRFAQVPFGPFLAAAGFALLGADRTRGATVLAAAAALWVAEVALMAELGYAGLSRFMVPAAIALCVVGAVGAASALARIPRSALGVRARGAVALGVLGLLVWSGSDLPADARAVGERVDHERSLLTLVERVERARDQSCEVRVTNFLFGPSVASAVERPISAVIGSPLGPLQSTVVFVDLEAEVPDGLERGVELGAVEEWRAYGFGPDCGGGPRGRAPRHVPVNSSRERGEEGARTRSASAAAGLPNLTTSWVQATTWQGATPSPWRSS